MACFDLQAKVSRERTVLLADDELGVRAILTYFLKRNGFRVLVATDGSEAVELFKAHSREIGTVLLDVQMPILNGPSALDQIRVIAPDVRAVFTSGLLKMEIQKSFPIPPPWTFLPKPFNSVELESIFPRDERF